MLTLTSLQSHVNKPIPLLLPKLPEYFHNSRNSPVLTSFFVKFNIPWVFFKFICLRFPSKLTEMKGGLLNTCNFSPEGRPIRYKFRMETRSFIPTALGNDPYDFHILVLSIMTLSNWNLMECFLFSRLGSCNCRCPICLFFLLTSHNYFSGI